MPINDYFDKYTAAPIYVFQLDINKLNIQWINIEATIPSLRVY